MQKLLENKWIFFNPTHIIFGCNSLDYISNIKHVKIALITTPGFKRRGVVRRIEKILEDRLIRVLDTVTPNPTIEEIEKIAEILKHHSPDCIIALGGGSSIDTAKVVARLIWNQNNPSLSSHFRDNIPFKEEKSLPVYTIPTTTGTGSEVTPFATVWDTFTKKKYSLSGYDLFPKTAFLDPILTLDQPELLTISTGLDAISHALESVWNKNANPITLALSHRSLEKSLQTLPELKKNAGNIKAREIMMEASLLAGMAISQTRTSLAHSISYPLTLEYSIPHGLACSFTLPSLLHFNAEADDGRLIELANKLGYLTTNDFENGLRELLSQLDVSTLITNYLPIDERIIDLVDRMITPGRADNNMRQASLNDVKEIIMNSR